MLVAFELMHHTIACTMLRGESDGNVWASLPHRWLHIALPKYREHAAPATYSTFSFEDLPPIPIELDDECDWLLKHGTPFDHSLQKYGRGLKPATVCDLAASTNVTLPPAFERFMTSPALQQRVRSCTDCYLDPGERIVKTIQTIPGSLVHFLSDSQSCALVSSCSAEWKFGCSGINGSLLLLN